MSDLDRSLRDLSWVNRPRPMADLTAAVRRRRRHRRTAMTAVAALLVGIAVPVALMLADGDVASEQLAGREPSMVCPRTFAAPGPDAPAPSSQLFPDDVSAFEVCIYDDRLAGDVEGQRAPARLRGALSVAPAEVQRVHDDFAALPVAGTNPGFCVLPRQPRLLVLGRADTGRATTVSIDVPCGSSSSNGRFTVFGPGKELLDALGLLQRRTPLMMNNTEPVIPEAGVGTRCPGAWSQPRVASQAEAPLPVRGAGRIDVCSYGEQERATGTGVPFALQTPVPVRETRVLLGAQAVQVAGLLESLPPSSGSNRACVGPPPPGVIVVVTRPDGSTTSTDLTLSCGSIPVLSDGATNVRPDDAALRALFIDPADPAGRLL